jgi:hypothetical protein
MEDREEIGKEGVKESCYIGYLGIILRFYL